MIQFDVATAFLNGRVYERVFVEPLKTVQVGRDRCLRLLEALYGLFQAL